MIVCLGSILAILVVVVAAIIAATLSASDSINGGSLANPSNPVSGTWAFHNDLMSRVQKLSHN